MEHSSFFFFLVDAQDALDMPQKNKLPYLSHLVLAAIIQMGHDKKKEHISLITD